MGGRREVETRRRWQCWERGRKGRKGQVGCRFGGGFSGIWKKNRFAIFTAAVLVQYVSRLISMMNSV